MGYIKDFIDLFMHLGKHLSMITSQYGVLVYLLLFAIIFCETGLVITPFLPGDSIVFAVGALAASGSLNLPLLMIVLWIAAIAGDTVNYHIGYLLRSKVADNKIIRFIKAEYFERTQEFFKRHGVKTIIIARFIPIIRTFAPFVAGVGKMPYRTFISFNVIGGVAWVTLFLFGGYFFGNLPLVKKNFSLVIMGIIIISLLPGVLAFIKNKYALKRT